MRYAFISDIHANLQAWKAVYEDIENNNVDRIICLGDVVGYGPNPAEVLKDVRAKVDAFVLGNHDAAVSNKLDSSLFNDDARKVLEWTRSQLKEDDLQFLGGFPLTLVGDGFLCAHGEFSQPGNFDYVGEADEALPSWKATDSSLLIVGHTHEPALFVMGASGTPRTVEIQDFVIDAGKRYLINIGSVGQPRGADTRSCYCIYDTESKAVYWRRVTFDVEPYRKALKATGLTLDPSYYLIPEPKPKTEEGVPAKRRIVFTPPKTPDKSAHDVVASLDLKTLPPRKKKIPMNRISAMVVLTIIVVLFGWRRTHPALDLDSTTGNLITITKGVLQEVREEIKPGNPVPGWIVHVDSRYKQRAGVSVDKLGKPFFYMVSQSDQNRAYFASGWVAAKPNQVWDVDASFLLKPDFSGQVTLALVTTDPKDKSGKIQDLFTQMPGIKMGGGWTRIREKVTIPSGVDRIRFQIRGKFKGTAAFRDMNLALLQSEGTAEAVAPQDETIKSSPAPADTGTEPANDPWKQKVQ